MTNTNFFVEIGNVVRDIGDNDYVTMANNNGRLNFAIAVNRAKKSGDEWVDEVSYLDFTCFGKLADNMSKMLKKGTKVCVTGYIKQDRWTKDDKNYSKLSLIADSVELLSRKEGGAASVNNSAPTFKPAENNSYSGEEGDFPEDIPF
jgi:single-strand DNA-binding protein